MARRDRFHQLLLIGTLLPLCWLWMQVVHELGHILAVWAAGGEIARVVLHPLAISRTDVAVDPQPLLTVWAGPVFGVLVPLIVLGIFHFDCLLSVCSTAFRRKTPGHDIPKRAHLPAKAGTTNTAPTELKQSNHWGRLRLRHLVRFFAGFCLVANGAYIGIAAVPGIGDAGQMLRHGTPIWCLFVFAAVTFPLGFWLWHGLGRDFGFGPNARPVEPRAAYLCAVLLLVTVVVGLAFSAR